MTGDLAETEVRLPVRPDCDLCNQRGLKVGAEYDAALRAGPWAFVCEQDFQHYCIGLGTGLGQRLVIRTDG